MHQPVKPAPFDRRCVQSNAAWWPHVVFPAVTAEAGCFYPAYCAARAANDWLQSVIDRRPN